MLERFKRHAEDLGLLHQGSYFLVAVSAGIDSVVLAHLLKRSGAHFGLVHCNFKLRDSASEEDEAFVRTLARQLDCKIYVREFDVGAYKAAHGVSTQMAARELRYAWFTELLQSGKGDGLIVAHHKDDQVETVLLNLLRGTGIEGVYGMAEKRDGIIRPMLPFTRRDICQFADAEAIAWREDLTNEQTDYKRNYLRIGILPLLDSHFPASMEMLSSSFGRIKDTGRAFFHLAREWQNRHVQIDGDTAYMAADVIRHVPGRSSLLFYWLRGYGFNFAQVHDILYALDEGSVGRQFTSNTHLANVDREQIIVGPKVEEWVETTFHADDVEVSLSGNQYDLLRLPAKGLVLDRNADNAMLDLELLSFPLRLRLWQEGDRFRPLGMKQFKKVSDFLIDLKIPQIRKRQVAVLCSGEEIVWVVGLRVDDRFKVGAYTREVLYIKKKSKHV